MYCIGSNTRPCSYKRFPIIFRAYKPQSIINHLPRSFHRAYIHILNSVYILSSIWLEISLKQVKIIHVWGWSLQQIVKQISTHPEWCIQVPWALIGMNTVFCFTENVEKKQSWVMFQNLWALVQLLRFDSCFDWNDFYLVFV